MNLTEFENKWVQKISDELLKSFPNDFINDETEMLPLPGKSLLKGTELFGSHEIIDTDGETLLRTDNIDKVKYILYANRKNPTQIKLPQTEQSLNSAVKNYEKHLDEILKIIVRDFKTEFPTSQKFTSVSNKIFQLLNLHRY